MAVDAYLKTAAAQLRRATQTIKDDANGMRHYIASVENDNSKMIQDLQKQIKVKETEAASVNQPEVRVALLKAVTQLRQQISQLQQVTLKEKEARLSQIQNMENAANDLDGRASDLESKPASF